MKSEFQEVFSFKESMNVSKCIKLFDTICLSILKYVSH